MRTKIRLAGKEKTARRYLASAGVAVALTAGLLVPALPALAGSITFIQSAENDSGTSGGKTPASVTIPSWTLTSNDEIVIGVAENKNDAITTPTGYTLLGSGLVGNGVYLALYGKQATSTDAAGTTVTFTLASGARWVVEAGVWGNATINTVSGPTADSSAGTTVHWPSVSWTGATGVTNVEFAAAQATANGTFPSYNAPTSSAGNYINGEGITTTNCGASCRNVGEAMVYLQGLTSSPESPGTTTDSQSGDHTYAAVVLAPAS